MPAPDASTAQERRAPATIVLATHGRPQLLRECVTHLADAMRPGDELVVVECCNPDAAEALGDLPVPVTHLAEAHQVKCAKLNTALRRAGHDVVLLTDDDCRVPRDWVDEMTAPFANPAVGVVFGSVRGLSELPGARAGVSLPPGAAPPEHWNYAHGASMAVRRRALRDIGGFDERLGAGSECRGGEEADVVMRAAARGWLCAIAGGATVHHLDWRDDAENRVNLLGYQRGSGAYLGAALRRDARGAAKTFALRLLHERGMWRDERRARGGGFRPRMTVAFVGGLRRGMRLAPERYLDDRADVSDGVHAHGRARVLWVTDEAPDRNGGGGNIRQAALLDVLADGADVTVLLAGHLSDDSVRARVTAVLEVPRPRPRSRESHRALRRRVRDLGRVLVRRRPADVEDSARTRHALLPVLRRIAPEFDAVIVQHLALAPLIEARTSGHWVVEVHNVPSERARQEAATETGARQRWLLARERAHAHRFQARMIAAYDRVIVVSDGDAAALTGGAAHDFLVVPNGVRTDRAPVELSDAPSLLLPASLNYRPNVLGALWFCDEVFPRVRAAVPDARFVLAGRDPVPEIRALSERPGIDVHADVPRMEPWIDWARVVVVPLHVGTGTRLKALEAMAAGRPLVGTSVGLEGLDLLDGEHARIVDDPEAMAAAIVDLLESRGDAEALAARARAHVDARFRWERVAQPVLDYLEELADRSPNRACSSRETRLAARPGIARRLADVGDV
ncbi:MAG TPA: glycosyltransferase [Acidimicrobiia bacterium]|nr:glycosyltransferase [Acidimicrobiia bacterium]